VPAQTDPLTQEFWERSNARELVIQRCTECATFYHPPVALCPNDCSASLVFESVSGSGHVYAFSIIHDTRSPAFDQFTPYVHATVTLDDAPAVIMTTNLPGVPLSDVAIGMAVEVDFEEIAPGILIPQFTSSPPMVRG
jgi:uncharacterized OB-fold protein